MTTVFAQQINVNDDKIGVVEWHVEDDAFVEAGDDLVDLETSKAVVTVTAELAGQVRLIAKKGAIVQVGAPLCRIGDDSGDTTPATVTSAAVTSATSPSAGPPPTPATAPRAAAPSTRPDLATTSVIDRVAPLPAPAGFATSRLSRRARETIESMGLSEAEFGGAGLVTAETILARQAPPALARPRLPEPAAKLPLVAAPGAPRTEPVSLGKRAEIDMLSTGESGLINSTVSVYFDAGPLRDRLDREGKFDGAIQPILLYELSRLLRRWPQFTAYFDAGEINFYDRIDLGIAIDLGRGLKVVTIREADRMMPIELHEAVIDFGLRYMDNKIQPNELIGSTFTVTDLSGLDVLHFKPLINGRQSAILGVGGDTTQPGQPMSFNLTFDHRVANGRDAALFLGDLRARLLSYAPIGSASAATARVRGASANARSGPLRCYSCNVESESYHRGNKDAVMFACFGADGSPIALCHACVSGWR